MPWLADAQADGRQLGVGGDVGVQPAQPLERVRLQKLEKRIHDLIIEEIIPNIICSSVFNRCPAYCSGLWHAPHHALRPATQSLDGSLALFQQPRRPSRRPKR
jgi:hypothetical protein